MGIRHLAFLFCALATVLVFQNCSEPPGGYNAASLDPTSPSPTPIIQTVPDHEPDFSISDIDPGLATISSAGNLIVNLDPAVNGQDTRDDSAAVQRAFNLAPANSTVFFPAGTFNFANTVTVKSRVSVAALGSVVLNMTAADSRPIFRMTNGSNQTVSGFAFRRGGIAVNNTVLQTQVVIQANTFSNIPGMAVSATNLKASRIYGNQFVNVGRSIAYTNNLAEPADQFAITKNTLTNVGSMGISVNGTGAGTVTVSDNVITFNANHAAPNEFGISVTLTTRGDSAVLRNKVKTLQAATATCTETGIRVQTRVGSVRANDLYGHWCQPMLINESATQYSVVADSFICAFQGNGDPILRSGVRNSRTSVAGTMTQATCPAN